MTLGSHLIRSSQVMLRSVCVTLCASGRARTRRDDGDGERKERTMRCWAPKSHSPRNYKHLLHKEIPLLPAYTSKHHIFLIVVGNPTTKNRRRQLRKRLETKQPIHPSIPMVYIQVDYSGAPGNDG